MPRTANTDDDELVARANRGDAGAFEEIYHRYRDWVVALAYRLLRDREEALEVLQETFSYLFGKLPDLVLTASLRTFLYPVVKHLCLDRLRRRRPTVDIDELADSLPHTPPAAPDVNPALLRALEELPTAQREVMVLRFVDDLSLEQIAEATQAPLGTVKSRLHHGLLVLRRLLE